MLDTSDTGKEDGVNDNEFNKRQYAKVEMTDQGKYNILYLS